MNEYFCTGAHQRPGANQSCGCNQNSGRDDRQGSGNPGCNPCPAEPIHGNREQDCPCRRGLVQALQMLLRSGLSTLVDFQAFAFITDDFLVGTTFVAPTTCAPAYDNLATPFTGSFSRFTPCACDYIDVTGPVSLPTEPTCTGLTAGRLNLCDITAISFGVTGDDATTITENYQQARRIFQTLLQPGCQNPCPPYPDPCDEPCRCDCGEMDNIGGSVSLVADGLVLGNVTVLGNIGKLLVLANDTDQRFYFVCSDEAAIVR